MERDISAILIHIIFLIDRISDAYSQRCIDVQRLVKSLDHGDIVSIQYAVKQGRVRLRDAMKCILEAAVAVVVSRTADSTAAEKPFMASAAY